MTPKREPTAIETTEILLADAGLRALQGLKGGLELIGDQVRKGVAQALDDRPHTSVGQAINGVVGWAVNKGKEFRVIGRVDLHRTPSLIDDESSDLRFKSDLVEDLGGRLSINAPLTEEIQRIGFACFNRGIPADRLKSFLESDEVLNFLVEEVLHREESAYRGSNVKAIIGSVIETTIRKLESRVNRAEKCPVDEAMDTEIRKKIEYFEKEYDPHDKRHTVANFIDELERTFSEYDIPGWLRKNKNLLKKLLRGRESEEFDAATTADSTRHVAQIIDEVYLERGQLNPEQFIDLHLDSFFQIYSTENFSGIPAFIKSALNVDQQTTRGVVILDLDSLEEFFEVTIPKLQVGDQGLIQLREKLIQCCLNKMSTMNPRVGKIIFTRNDNITGEDFDTTPSAEAGLSQAIIAQCRIVASHVDVRNLLADPRAIPPEIAKNFDDWFDRGELRRSPYHKYLRGVFGQMEAKKEEEGFTAENFNRLKGRVKELFESVTTYLTSVSQQLEIPTTQLASINEVNDYAELVKICCTSPNPQERFAARRKIELAFLIYSCLITPRYVYQEYEAKAVKKVLERRENLEIRDKDAVVLRFLDNADGTVVDISGKDPAKHSEASVKSVNLIPATFNGVNCGLLPTNGEPNEYMGKKSLQSMLTNLLNDDKKRAKDMTDLLRMTIVVDSMADLSTIQQHLETNYISFGRNIKKEDRYVKTAARHQVGVSANPAKSDDYKTSRYVVDVVIPDEHPSHELGGIPTYAVPVEIRILLREDVMKEKSDNHPASHKNYERTRLAMIVPTLAPQEVFPGHYVKTSPNPDDIFQRTTTRLKTREEHRL